MSRFERRFVANRMEDDNERGTTTNTTTTTTTTTMLMLRDEWAQNVAQEQKLISPVNRFTERLRETATGFWEKRFSAGRNRNMQLSWTVS